MASSRYRITIPGKALAAAGIDNRAAYLTADVDRAALPALFDGADAVVLGKLTAPLDDFPRLRAFLEGLMERFVASGSRVLADFCDDHFAHPVIGPVYRWLAGAADVVTASTPQLAEVLNRHTRAPVRVITDPVEGERGAPASVAAVPSRLLWFGHPSNLDTLRPGLEQLRKCSLPHSLKIMTAPGEGEALALAAKATFRAWSTSALFEELRLCEAVILPSDPRDASKATKSTNRFTESLWAGRFVIAHPLPAYEALACYGWVGEDLGTGLAWLQAHPDEATQRIAAGQDAIARQFVPAVVAQAWRRAIEQAVTDRRSRSPS